MGFFVSSKPKTKPSSKAGSPSKSRRSPSPPPHRTLRHTGQTVAPQSHPPPPSYYTQPWSPQPTFQPAGYLPPPPGWTPGSPTPIVVNQYYLSAPSSDPSSPPSASASDPCATAFSKAKGQGTMPVPMANGILPGSLNLPQQPSEDGLSAWHSLSTQALTQGAALYDQISSKLNRVMTAIDQNRFEGHERELLRYGTPTTTIPKSPGSSSKPLTQVKKLSKKKKKTLAVSSSEASVTYFAKVDSYANSKLPLNLDPLRLTIKTWPLVSLAATFSESVYENPRGPERSTYLDANWRTGSKTMVIKSVANSTFKAIVFAIRGTASFMDWVVNLDMAPVSPAGFLDDLGNLCHSGFLSVARSMVAPVAARLRQLLEEDPRRAKYSLVITGHSAGGAIASLLFSHMLSTSTGARSELRDLVAGKAFRRVHCITFGTPPVTLLPLRKPDNPKLENWLFMTFVNEGDPVARADKEYIKSLVELYVKSTPEEASTLPCSGSKSERKKTPSSSKPSKSHSKIKSSSPTRTKNVGSGRELRHMPMWPVPPCTLSVPGSIYVLRSGEIFRDSKHRDSRVHFPQAPYKNKGKKTVEERADEGVVAQKTTDGQLRGVIWGDPICHVMKLYTLRVETLVIGAVTWGGRI